MRALIACLLALVDAATMLAQTTAPASLQSLNFLQGIWTLHDSQQTQTMEFHWSTLRGNRFLVGRSWSGAEGSCPWCVTQTGMLARYDPTSNQIRIHFVDRHQHVLDFHLVALGKRSAQFLTDTKPALPTYRLTYTLSEAGALSSTLEKKPDPDSAFLPLMQSRFNRR
jgi:hypothetical protein